MDKLGELKFDPIQNDHKLARDYIKKHNNEFESIGFPRSGKYEKVCDDVIIYTTRAPDNIRSEFKTDLTEDAKTIKHTLLNLSKKIEENSDLFCDLYSYVYNTKYSCKEEIQLLVHDLLYLSDSEYTIRCQKSMIGRRCRYSRQAPMHALSLNFYLDAKNINVDVEILTTPESAILYYLFTELCHEVGLIRVKLGILDKGCHKFPVASRDCFGVITSNADVDSAIDVLLDSAPNHVWSITKILVQESVYDSVKKALEWKCEGNIDSGENLTYGDKTIILDCVGRKILSAVDSPQVIQVEAYRTTKELVYMINIAKTIFLSLWSQDISEVNEVTFAADLPVVWVNDFGAFDGPLKASHIICNLSNLRYLYHYDGPALHLIHKKWQNLNKAQRCQILKQCISNIEDYIYIDYLNILQAVSDDVPIRDNNFVYIADGLIWMGYRDCFLIINEFDIKNCFKYLIQGEGLLIVDFAEHFVKLMVEHGIPIAVESDSGKNYVWGTYMEDGCTKIVRQTFGTIFAN